MWLGGVLMEGKGCENTQTLTLVASVHSKHSVVVQSLLGNKSEKHDLQTF